MVFHDSVTLSWGRSGDESIRGYQVLLRSRDGTEYGNGMGEVEFVSTIDDTGSDITTQSTTSTSDKVVLGVR